MYIQGKKPQAIYSTNVILKAFNQLMKFETYEEITITQLCQYADIARTTFYRHFESKDDVVELYLHQISKDLFSDYPKPRDMHQVILDYYQVVMNYQDLLFFISKNHLDYLLKKSICSILCNFSIKDQIHKSPIPHDFAMEYISSIVCSILLLWTEHSFLESIEEISNITETCLSGISIEE